MDPILDPAAPPAVNSVAIWNSAILGFPPVLVEALSETDPDDVLIRSLFTGHEYVLDIDQLVY